MNPVFSIYTKYFIVPENVSPGFSLSLFRLFSNLSKNAQDYMYVFMFCLCATGGCETASYTFLFRHISALAHDARDGCCFFSLKSVGLSILRVSEY